MRDSINRVALGLGFDVPALCAPASLAPVLANGRAAALFAVGPDLPVLADLRATVRTFLAYRLTPPMLALLGKVATQPTSGESGASGKRVRVGCGYC